MKKVLKIPKSLTYKTIKCLTVTFVLLFNIDKINAQDTLKEKINWLEFRGYVKDLQNVSFGNKLESATTGILLHNRLNFKVNFSSTVSAKIEMRNRIFAGNQILPIPDFNKQIEKDNGLLSLSFNWLDNKTLIGNTIFDRAYVQYQSPKMDVKIGRQRINWGINTIWNPNDIFDAYNFLDFDYEERPGSDAVRLQFYPKENLSIEAAYKPAKDKNKHVAAALFKVNQWQYDFQFLGGIAERDAVLGLGWAGRIGEMGFKGESTLFQPLKKNEDSLRAFVSSLMLDYTTSNAWYFSASILFNYTEGVETFNANTVFNPTFTAKNLSPYRYNFYAGVGKTITPIVSMNVSILYAPKFDVLVFFPSLTYNVAQNFETDLVVQSFFASYPTRFKAQGTSVFLRFKWSF